MVSVSREVAVESDRVSHLEHVDTAAEAAVREVHEESGLDVRIIASLGATRYPLGAAGEHRTRVNWFLADPIGGELQLAPDSAVSSFVDESATATFLAHRLDPEIVRRAYELPRAGQ